MNTIVPGGAGYIGAVLVPWLLADGHRVTVFDTMWFGHGYLPDNPNLTVIKGDVRYPDLLRTACEGKDAVIYLASLSNNAMCERDPLLHDFVNIHAFPPAVAAAKAAGVKRFIFASSVAAYGSTYDALETWPLAPSTLYGHAKDKCEAWLLAHQQPEFTTVITRSASVCGYSPHQRFDLTVNMMVHDAVRKGVITVNGGEQKRSHIHIQDACDFYRLLLEAPQEKIAGQVFNVVAENATVAETARLVANEIGARIVTHPRSDNRSYTVDGTKARRVLGFAPKRTVRQAVIDLKARFDDGYWPDSLTNSKYMNLADDLA